MAHTANLYLQRSRQTASYLGLTCLALICFLLGIWIASPIVMGLTVLPMILTVKVPILAFLNYPAMILPGLLCLLLTAYLAVKAMKKKHILRSAFWCGAILASQYVIYFFASAFFY